MSNRKFKDPVVQNIYSTMMAMSSETLDNILSRPVGQQEIAFVFGFNGEEYPAYFGGSKTSACYAGYCAGKDRRAASKETD